MDVTEITGDLVSYDSSSQLSNAKVSSAVAGWMRKAGMTVEQVSYTDGNGLNKVNVVGKKGRGTGGLAILGHSDVVPASGWDSDPFRLSARNGKLYGRGSADMKGPIACGLVAAQVFSKKELRRPVYVIVTADEETDCGGAAVVMKRSKIFKNSRIKYGIIAEPTLLDVVHAHKGSLKFAITAKGKAAHSSTGKGMNANHKLIPFLNDIVELERKVLSKKFLNNSFSPPHPTLNIVMGDGGSATNITVPVSYASINCRPMPDQKWSPVIERVRQLGKKHGVQVTIPKRLEPLGTPVDSRIIRESLQVTGKRKSKTVSYGTDGMVFGKSMELVVMGPGSIQQAHTTNEWIARDQLTKGVDVFTQMVHRFCIENPE
ncbi:MAG TPA: acetylornithine deacetylase [Candidatus Latescibacteria bacterium]|nr:acetylornithine deacetylase [Candidatus Latescibacterota bacterium]|tara:strand:- start:1020 stop:2141 length:1122 start_codon:yes stop_codon:yes gene_type:complete